MIAEAANLAYIRHYGQARKYSGLPYFTHLHDVATILGGVNAPEHVIAAAYLHDILEDTSTKEEELRRLFPASVVDIVVDVTDVYTPVPGLNRAARKRLERERLAEVSAEAQTLKVADLLDNTASIVNNDPKFAKTYLAEKRALLEVLTGAHPVLLARAFAQIRGAK